MTPPDPPDCSTGRIDASARVACNGSPTASACWFPRRVICLSSISPKGRFDALTETPDFERDPKLSPDNRYVSFRRGSDLYAIEIASKVVTRLTSSGSDTLLNGQLDWVYPEELELGTAHWWSPDSRSIAYLQFDIAREPVFPQVSLLNPRVACWNRSDIRKRAIRTLRCSSWHRAGDRRRNEVDGPRRAVRGFLIARVLCGRPPAGRFWQSAYRACRTSWNF